MFGNQTVNMKSRPNCLGG